MKKRTLWVLIVFFDQVTKLLIRGMMSHGESVSILPFFRITYIENRGAAFGFLSNLDGGNYLLIALNIAALIFLIYNYKELAKDKVSAYAWVIIMGGAVGNFSDRIFIGAVVDFLDFSIGEFYWPVFNIADTAITVGLFIFLFQTLKQLFLKKTVSVGG